MSTAEIGPGDRVHVSFGDGQLHAGRVERLRDSEVRVVFDDPTIYGGAGAAWVNHDQVQP